jgi:hypothetical protein
MSLRIFFKDLCRGEVNEFEVTLRIDHEVFRLDVSANDGFRCKILEDENDGSCKELAVLG